eukprot:s248_g1.t2
MYKAWLLLLAATRVHCKWCDAEQNNQCIINASKHAPPESVELSYPGNVLITKGCRITSDSTLRIDAAGTVTVEQGSVLTTRGPLTINGSSIFIHQSSLTASGLLTFIGTVGLGGQEHSASLQDPANASLGLEMIDSSIQGQGIEVSCSQSWMNFQGNSSLLVTDDNKQLQIQAARFTATNSKAQLVARNIRIASAGDLQLEAYVPGISTKEKVIPTVLDLTAQGDMSLGNRSVTWTLSRLNASANNLIVVQKGQVRVQEYNTCKNTGGSRLEDKCQTLLSSWSGSRAFSWPPSADDGNVSFDLVLMAKNLLTISGDANLQASSALLCSGQQVALNDHCVVDVSGAGCPAASMTSPQRAGGVALPGPQGAPWLAGGGTHVGRGGYALWSDETGAHVNRETIPLDAQYDRYNETRDVLPTQGASGGATGIPHGPGPPIWSGHSSGGGMIWLSGLVGLTFGAAVRLDASGTDGAAGKDKSNHFASGGGSGGQILIFSGPYLKAPDDQLPTLKASGGNGACTSHSNLWVVSGAGGGGFVGFNWSKPSGDSLLLRPNFNILINGGALGSDETGHGCNLIPGREMLEATFGREGQNMSITACAGGHAGVFCDLCDKDSWSDGVGMCQPCNPIPTKGFHPNTTQGWSGPDCPYSCSVGVPNVASNPQCLDGMDYALTFFGGWKGVLGIACAIVGTALLLLWRRRKANLATTSSRPLLEDLSGSTVSTWSRRVCASNGSRGAMEFQINRDNLPFHVCRVYLMGDNTRDAPWSLTQLVPAGLEEMVLEHRWQQLATEVKKTTEVSRASGHLISVLRRLYPPLAPLVARWQRLRRARKVQQVLMEFCDSERLWTWIREPGKELVLRFGCDAKATLAHLDVLDFARSRLDWAPVNLLKDAWLIPVQGQGSFSDPFEVDISDPVLQLLEHTDFGSTAVLSVISTFNRAARKIQQDDLRKDEDDSLQQLHETVEQCASQCGLAGCVQACVISMNRRGSRHRTSSAAAATLAPSPTGSVASPTQSPQDGVTSENSFMDLVEQGQSNANAPLWSRRTKRSELRLCLVFTQFSTLASLAESVSSAESTPAKAKALTTPMSLQAFNELLRHSASNIGEDTAAAQSAETNCNNRGLQRLLLKWGKGSEGAAARTLVFLGLNRSSRSSPIKDSSFSSWETCWEKVSESLDQAEARAHEAGDLDAAKQILRLNQLIQTCLQPIWDQVSQDLTPEMTIQCCMYDWTNEWSRYKHGLGYYHMEDFSDAAADLKRLPAASWAHVAEKQVSLLLVDCWALRYENGQGQT